jgi:restriction endonuclease S subunit
LNSEIARNYYLSKAKTTTNISNLTFEDLGELIVPIPQLEVQQQIVDELDGYQRIIDGAKAILANYKVIPDIPDNSPRVKIGELCNSALGGGTPATRNIDYWNGDIPWITSADITEDNKIIVRKYITRLGAENSTTNIIPQGNVIIASRVGLGKVASNSFDVSISQDLQGFILDKERVLTQYFVYAYSLLTQEIVAKSRGTTIKGITKEELLRLCIPLPDINIQQTIVEQITQEQALVEPSKKLIEVFTRKMQNRINEVWGE